MSETWNAGRDLKKKNKRPKDRWRKFILIFSKVIIHFIFSFGFNPTRKSPERENLGFCLEFRGRIKPGFRLYRVQVRIRIILFLEFSNLSLSLTHDNYIFLFVFFLFRPLWSRSNNIFFSHSLTLCFEIYIKGTEIFMCHHVLYFSSN